MAIPAKKSKVSKGASVKKSAVKAGKARSATKKALLKSPVFIKSENKGDFLEQLSTLKQIKAKSKIPAERPLSLRNNLSLALLSPYRLPIDAEKLAMQSARVAGMAFVVIGALLTIFHLPVVNDELVRNATSNTQVAQLLALGPGPSDGECAGCESRQIDTYRFLATISVTPDYDAKKYVTKINTSGANKVEIKLVDSAGKIQTIGYGEKQDSTSGSWLHTWDASSVAAGTYKIYGSVSNSRGTYPTSKVTTTVMGNGTEITPPPAPTPSPTPTPPPPPANTGTETATTSTGNSTTNTNTTPETTAPEFSISVASASDLSELAEVEVKVADAGAVEIFVLPKNATTPRYLGLANIKEKGLWRFLWNTANSPNGDYRLFAVAKLNSGKSNSPYKSVRVNNKVTTAVPTETKPTEPVEVVRTDTNATGSVSTTRPLPPPTNPPAPPIYMETREKIAEVEEEFKGQEFVRQDDDIAHLMPSENEMQSIEEEIEKIMGDYEIDIETEIENLKVALRSGDQAQVDLITKRIEELKNKIIKNNFAIGDDNVLSFIGQRLGEEFSGLTEKVEHTEKIIRERVGDEVFKDTDADGISDYDEAVLYETDPESADTDSDGFTDGAEILSGYDPKDSSPEAAVVFESPQNKGLERKDLLAVTSIGSQKRIENAGENNQAEHPPAALIKGKGLPNSFVTLYIFSTPVIVTVKTDAEGNWEYIFDKELEDGEHEMYVGITDNTGSIVAKSEPLRFVKTAEAFTPVAQAQNAEVTFTQTDPGFLTQNMIMLVMSISVVIIGLILMLLGLHLKTRRSSGEHLVQEGLITT